MPVATRQSTKHGALKTALGLSQPSAPGLPGCAGPRPDGLHDTTPGAGPAQQPLHLSPPTDPSAWHGPRQHGSMVLIGTSTLAGSRYGDLNQDAVLAGVLHSDAEMARARMPQCYAAVVLDGHGMLGEAAANDAGRALLHHVQHSSLHGRPLADVSTEELELVLHGAFLAGHEAALCRYDAAPSSYVYPRGAPGERRYTLRREADGTRAYFHPATGPRLLEFGTTATLVLVQGRTAVVAHVGDSLAVVGRAEGDDYRGQGLTRAHCGADPEEVERVTKMCGGHINFRSVDGYITVDNPPGMRGNFALAMTRALGHKMMSSYGVIPAPTVLRLALHPDDICIIAASDGVWEGLGPCEAVREVGDALAEGRSVASAAHALCQSSLDAVHAQSRGARPDNTTAVVLVLGDGGEGEEEGGAGSLE